MATVRDLADAVMGGRLEETLRDWRDEGLSYDDISRRLGVLGIDVTREAVRRWCIQFDIEKPIFD